MEVAGQLAAQIDIWEAVCAGDVLIVGALTGPGEESNINARNTFGVTPLHLAASRGELEIVELLLFRGAKVELVDWENGWTALHRALHLRFCRIASCLIRHGSSLSMKDKEGFTPLDLLSLKRASLPFPLKSRGQLFTWGSSVHFQLGYHTEAQTQETPKRVELLADSSISRVALGRYHTLALDNNGCTWTWGGGRYGKTGFEDQRTLVVPVRIDSLKKQVVSIAASDCHSLACTVEGELYSWGSNASGQLGYRTPPQTPFRGYPTRIDSLSGSFVTQVAAGSGHSLGLSSTAVFAWGDNGHGQLGLGLSHQDTGVPTVIERLQKVSVVTASGVHSLAISSDGELFLWGNGLVTPSKLNVPYLPAVPSATVHPRAVHRFVTVSSSPVTAYMIDTHGTLFAMDMGWSYPMNQSVKRVLPTPWKVPHLLHRQVLQVSASSSAAFAITSHGDVLWWTNSARLTLESSASLSVNSIHHVRQIESIQAGTDHTAAIVRCNVPPIPILKPPPGGVTSLQDLAQIQIMSDLDIKNVISLLEIADTYSASLLSRFCLQFIAANLELFFTPSYWPYFMNLSPNLLRALEEELEARTVNRLPLSVTNGPRMSRSNRFTDLINFDATTVAKRLRTAKKKLFQIDQLQERSRLGVELDHQQKEKLQLRDLHVEEINILSECLRRFNLDPLSFDSPQVSGHLEPSIERVPTSLAVSSPESVTEPLPSLDLGTPAVDSLNSRMFKSPTESTAEPHGRRSTPSSKMSLDAFLRSPTTIVSPASKPVSTVAPWAKSSPNTASRLPKSPISGPLAGQLVGPLAGPSAGPRSDRKTPRSVPSASSSSTDNISIPRKTSLADFLPTESLDRTKSSKLASSLPNRPWTTAPVSCSSNSTRDFRDIQMEQAQQQQGRVKVNQAGGSSSSRVRSSSMHMSSSLPQQGVDSSYNQWGYLLSRQDEPVRPLSAIQDEQEAVRLIEEYYSKVEGVQVQFAEDGELEIIADSAPESTLPRHPSDGRPGGSRHSQNRSKKRLQRSKSSTHQQHGKPSVS
eukprot:GILJ01010589.1.p1 GENE.GILJ01010589.1~~GILJ01010589.1.p1  ORF type:complete len:1032 (-),score=167.36 GILJ01010589.1:58-3153(-)